MNEASYFRRKDAVLSSCSIERAVVLLAVLKQPHITPFMFRILIIYRCLRIASLNLDIFQFFSIGKLTLR